MSIFAGQCLGKPDTLGVSECAGGGLRVRFVPTGQYGDKKCHAGVTKSVTLERGARGLA